MSNRIKFQHWGTRGPIQVPAYAVRQSDESSLDAVCRAIASKSRLKLACRPSDQGTELERGTAVARHYELTFGRPVPRRLGGGMSVEGSVWVALPIAPPAPKENDRS